MGKVLSALKALAGLEPAHAVYCDLIGQQSCNLGTGCKFRYQCWYSPGQHAYTYWSECQWFVLC